MTGRFGWTTRTSIGPSRPKNALRFHAWTHAADLLVLKLQQRLGTRVLACVVDLRGKQRAVSIERPKRSAACVHKSRPLTNNELPYETSRVNPLTSVEAALLLQ